MKLKLGRRAFYETETHPSFSFIACLSSTGAQGSVKWVEIELDRTEQVDTTLRDSGDLGA